MPYPVTLDVYGKYKYIRGDLYEDDVWNDDYLGKFVHRNILYNLRDY